MVALHVTIEFAASLGLVVGFSRKARTTRHGCNSALSMIDFTAIEDVRPMRLGEQSRISRRRLISDSGVLPFVLVDTGHTTMALMDPVQLTRTYSAQIVEYHLKDVAPERRGRYKGQPDRKPRDEAAGKRSSPALIHHGPPVCRAGKGGCRSNSPTPKP
jgi:hypothetical protein